MRGEAHRTRQLSRRRFLRGALRQPAPRPLPPGLQRARLEACTACGACAEACPTGIVVFSGGAPALDFSRGECTFCGACGEACPEALFETSPPVFDHVAAIGEACLARSGVACMSCRDLCPEDAIRFRPRVGGPFLPEIRNDACTGCGACVAGCPANAIAMAWPHEESADAG